MIIKNGRILDPKTNTDQIADLKVSNGLIQAIGSFTPAENEEVIDATGKVVAPGLIDVHVHFRDPGLEYKEDIITGAKAAAAGGFTTVVCMANTSPIADNIDTLNYVITKGNATPIHVLTTAAVTPNFCGSKLTDFQQLKAAGAVGFTDDGKVIMDETIVRNAMQLAKELNVPISFHEEDDRMVKQAGINKGKISEKIGYGDASSESEYSIIERDCKLALETGAKVSIQHISAGESVAIVQKAQEQGADVWAEATPQHFSATENLVLTQGTLARVNPPLRTEWDRMQVIQGLKENVINIIATDHAPHTMEEKDVDMSKAPSGMIGLEISLAMGITHLVRENHLSLIHLLEKMTINPANLYGLDAGSLEVGKDADIVIFDPDEKWTIETFVSKSQNSPFVGCEVYGKVHHTICGGNII